jgi:hypothetical protein
MLPSTRSGAQLANILVANLMRPLGWDSAWGGKIVV